MDMQYYQLGGHRAAISLHGGQYGTQRDFFTPLQRHLRRPDESIELVLGIKPSGSSHLLLTWEEAKLFEPDRYLFKKSSPATEFYSLSPIVFKDAKQLEEKLDNLTPKKSGARDTSRLNKGYEGQSHGAGRSRVESARVFYRILRNRLDQGKYNIRDTSWASSIRIVTFSCNTWLSDTRSLAQRNANPRVLDVGWSEASLPDLGDEQKTYSHIQFANNINLAPGGDENTKREPFQWGASQLCSPQEIKDKVQGLFGEFSSTRPVVLVVHNWDSNPGNNAVPVKNVLWSLDINVDAVTLDLKDLMWPPVRRYAPKDPRRPRSASPTPHNRSSRRPSPPPPPRSFEQVYVVDVGDMSRKIFGTQDCYSLSQMRRRLGMYEDQGFCAGNECRMLFEVFREMAKRGPIDDQKEEWPLGTLAASASVPSASASEPSASLAFHDDESDYGEEDESD
ncbi:hypothetical protein FB45DRAFT_894480 [Roridomyces roridus]|uniref:Uncharacterized protein n=1 Tax=Roridomyces roridus TaxID=1738132 RepID=A0AAD7CG74_9AGAR|nr:hypothetical protein FB45DRAFT_894480 [Roridomyces roridus]